MYEESYCWTVLFIHFQDGFPHGLNGFVKIKNVLENPINVQFLSSIDL